MSKMNKDLTMKDVQRIIAQANKGIDEVSVKSRTNTLDILKDSIYQKFYIIQEQMQTIAEKKIVFESKQLKLDALLKELQPFVIRNEIKKQKAAIVVREAEKYCHKQRRLLKLVNNNTEDLKQKEAKMILRIEKLQAYKKLLDDTILMLPSDYVKMQKDESIEGLISRFKSLFYINQLLFNIMNKKSEELKELKDQEHQAISQLSLRLMESISATKSCGTIRERKANEMQSAEIKYHDDYDILREKIVEFGIVLKSLDNITNKSIFLIQNLHRQTADILTTKSSLLQSCTPPEKLAKIKECVDAYKNILHATGNRLNNPFLDTFIKQKKQ